jgi:hypothetical protein
MYIEATTAAQALPMGNPLYLMERFILEREVVVDKLDAQQFHHQLELGHSVV